MIFSRHRFTRTFAVALAAPAAHEAPVIEKELQQAQPGAATVQMAPQRQAVAQRFCRNKDGWASKGDMISNAYLANE